MGILGELNRMVKTGQVDQLHAFLSEEISLNNHFQGSISSYIGMNDVHAAGAYRRVVHHNTEISLAAFHS